MPHTLAVTVHVDLDLKEVTLDVTGCLTSDTHASLLPLIAQARRLDPAPRITVDLLHAGHIDLDGLVPLQHHVEAEPGGASFPMICRVPDPLPECRRTVPTVPTDWAGTGGPSGTSPVGAAPLALVRGGEVAARDADGAIAPGDADDAIAPGDADDAIAPGDADDAIVPSASPSAPEARPRTRREEILEGSAQMFAEHGYYGASLRDISRHIGISHPGLMHHFASKDALLGGVIDQLEAHAQTVLDQVGTLSASPEAMLRSLAAHWHPASLPVRLLTTLGAESVSGDHPGRFRMARLRRVHEHVLEQCFLQFDRQGLLRPGLDPAFASRAMLGLVLSLAVREKTVRTMQNGLHDDAPLEEISRLTHSFLLPDDVG